MKIVEDVLVPGIVPVVDYLTEKFPESEPGKYADMTGIGMCVVGYGLNAFGIGGNMSKNIGIASLNWAVNSVRKLIAGTGITRSVNTASTGRLAMRPVSSRVSDSASRITRSYQPEFEKASAF